MLHFNPPPFSYGSFSCTAHNKTGHKTINLLSRICIGRFDFKVNFLISKLISGQKNLFIHIKCEKKISDF